MTIVTHLPAFFLVVDISNIDPGKLYPLVVILIIGILCAILAMVPFAEDK